MRDNSIDTVGGLMVLYMIFGHCYNLDLTDWNFRYFLALTFYCFMPWFFFKSGMYHRDGLTVNETWKKTFPKLCRPYVAFSIIGFIPFLGKQWMVGDVDCVHYILSQVKEIILHSAHGGAAHLWFLVTLLLVKSFSPLVLNKLNRGGWIACGIIGWTFSWVNDNLVELSFVPEYLMNLFPGMFFYGLGYTMRTRQYDKHIFWLSIAIFLLAYIYPSNLSFKANRMLWGSYPLFLIYASAAIVMFNNLAKIIGRNVWLLTSMGRDSMYWYCAHWMLLLVIRFVFDRFFPLLDGLSGVLLTFITLMFLLAIMRPVAYSAHIKKLLGL